MTTLVRQCVLALWFLAVISARGEEPGSGRQSDDFPVAEPAAVGIDARALEWLRRRAEMTDSDALVIVKDGKIVANWTFGKEEGPIEAMSATKSVVSLAIGLLIEQGKIKSLDQPVYEFYPEWKQGRKRQITVRHLLNHTSGLQDQPTAGEINDTPDCVQFALAAELSNDPGTRFFYSNKAVNLLAGIVRKASGKRMDEYIGDNIFKPLGITEFYWTSDKAGNPHAYAGLQIRARDFAKVGQMVLDGGTWRGKRIISEEWIKLSTTRSQDLEPTCGLLWWTIQDESLVLDDAFLLALKAFNPSDETVKALERMKDKPIASLQFWPAVGEILRKDQVIRKRLDELNQLGRQGKGPVPRKEKGKVVGFMAQGYLGQFLVILPESRLVAVRQFRSPAVTNRGRPDAKPWDPDKIDTCAEFPHLVQALVTSKRSP